MIRTLVIAALFAAGTLNGAIKKAPEEKPAPPPAEKKRGLDDLAEELRKRAERNGGKLDFEEKDLADFLRSALEELGVPAEQLKKLELPDLMKLMREKNPDAFKGFGSGRPPGMDKKTERKLEEHYGQLLEGHRPGTLAAAKATFALRDAKKAADPLAFATGVRGDGWLITKASEVSGAGELQCEIGGKWVAAKVVRSWPEHDLALLQTAAQDLPAVKWSESSAPDVGTFISAVAPEGRDPVAIGVVSVLPRNEQSKGRGFLGVRVDRDDKGMLKVSSLVEKGPAQASGIQMDDRILSIDGQKPDSTFTFTKMISDRKAGDKVRLKVQRGEAIVEKEIALADRGVMVGGPVRDSNDKMNSMSGTMSKRRTDFASVMQTDLPLQAAQCGGPVTDLDGNVIGVVIARSGRIETMVLPSGTIRQLLAGVDFSTVKKDAPPKPEAPRPAVK